eukprot:s5733_g4.t1
MAHVVLVQAPRDEVVTSLITISDPWLLPHQGAFLRIAVTTPAHIEYEFVLHQTALADRCLHPASDFVCEVWRGDHRLQAGQPHMGRNGFGYVAYVQQIVHDHEPDQAGFLQRPQSSVPTRPASFSWPQQDVTVDFRQVTHAYEIFDSHLFLPAFDLPCVDDNHAAASWIRDWWDYVTAFDMVCIYVDGSFAAKPTEDAAPAGAAIAAFVRTWQGWKFAGALSSSLSSARSAYLAELYGTVVAHKLAYDLLKLNAVLCSSKPRLIFRFDALTVGRQAAGDWSSVSHKTVGCLLRAISLLFRTRYDVCPHYEHVRGHTGETGNELVDLLAMDARFTGGLTPFEDWLQDNIGASKVSHAQWFWMLFAEEFGHCWRQSQLCLPVPLTQPTADVLPIAATQADDDSAAETTVAHLALRLVTCNVLSLKGSKDTDTNMTGIARQTALFQQMQEDKILIFGLQETRLRKLHQVCDPDFHLFKSAATEAGHYGILVGFAK